MFYFFSHEQMNGINLLVPHHMNQHYTPYLAALNTANSGSTDKCQDTSPASGDKQLARHSCDSLAAKCVSSSCTSVKQNIHSHQMGNLSRRPATELLHDDMKPPCQKNEIVLLQPKSNLQNLLCSLSKIYLSEDEQGVAYEYESCNGPLLTPFNEDQTDDQSYANLHDDSNDSHQRGDDDDTEDDNDSDDENDDDSDNGSDNSSIEVIRMITKL